jgi:CcmD family protein
VPNNLSFLFAAFVVIWLLIFAYVAFIGGRVQGLRQDIELLREELAARGAAETPSGEAPAGHE